MVADVLLLSFIAPCVIIIIICLKVLIIISSYNFTVYIFLQNVYCTLSRFMLTSNMVQNFAWSDGSLMHYL